jgi:hypothetical protein
VLSNYDRSNCGEELPLFGSRVARPDPAVVAALHTFAVAPASQQTTWETNYANALSKADESLDVNARMRQVYRWAC